MKTLIGSLAAACLIAVALLAAGGSSAATDVPDRAGAPPEPRGERYRCPHGDENGFKARRLIGKSLRRARKIARRHDCGVRVTKRNGKNLVVTADYSPSRINVGVRLRHHRRVTSIQGIG